MTVVYIASPFRKSLISSMDNHMKYAEDCIKHSLDRGESPIAVHLLYPRVLDETIEEQRKLGMRAGIVVLERAHILAVYTDYGISEGMQKEIEFAHKFVQGIEIEFRSIK